MEVTKHGFYIMSAKIMETEDCEKIINFIENNLDNFKKNEPRPGYNTNTLELNISIGNNKKIIEDAKEIDELIFDYVSKALDIFISKDTIKNYYNITENIADSGYQLRKVIGPTQEHQDGPELRIVSREGDISFRIGTLVMSLKDTGDKLIFPEQDITISLGEGEFVFFPPYWTHPHYTEWSGTDGYRIQTWITNTRKSK